LGNDDVNSWRWKIRAAISTNLQILPHILTGAKGRRHHGDPRSIDFDHGLRRR